MHSGLLLFVWLLAVASLQFLDNALLALVLCASIVATALLAPRRGWRLFRRIRFILIAILVLFAGFTPGEAVFVDFPRISPSREGLMLAFEHVARVLVVVMFVALLMERLSAPRLVAALYALLRSFRTIGVPADRVAIRTLLVLRLVEAEKTPRWDHWLSEEAEDRPGPITIARERFRPRDYALMAGLAVLLCVALVWGAR